jgi:hypothetical protein
VFDGAINVRFDGGLVSLVPEGAEKGPLNVVLRLPAGRERMSSLGIRAGDKAISAGSRLDLGGRYRVLFGAARIYSPSSKLPSPLLGEREIAENLQAATKTAILNGNMAGLGGLLSLVWPGAAAAKTTALNMFASAALPRFVRLERAFSSEEKSALKEAAGELIGLGPGLTPSSDDALAGLVLLCVLYSRNHVRANRSALLVAEAVASLPRGRTTILGEEFLRQAASGRGNERVTALCTAMLTGRRGSVERETKRVLGIGETSGTDAVLGIVLGAMFCSGRRSALATKGPE